MATVNPFDLLEDDAEDPSQLIAAHQNTTAAAPKAAVQPTAKPAKLPSKPLPPAQAAKEAKNEGNHGGRGGGHEYGRGRGSGGRYRRDGVTDGVSFSSDGMPAGQVAAEHGESGKSVEKRGHSGSRGPSRGGRRGGFNNGEAIDGERPHRLYDRRSGTGRGNEMKRDGAGRGNWGTQTDELAQLAEVVDEVEKTKDDEKPTGDEAGEGNMENPTKEDEEKEAEDKEMTLEEYEKLLEEKRKALQTLKTEERKVDIKEFESMQQLSSKKNNNDDVFIKLGAEKEKRREAYEKEEKAKKSVSIGEFLKPPEAERYYNPGGRGRGRGRGRLSRGEFSRDTSGHNNATAPAIEDPGQFPTLGA